MDKPREKPTGYVFNDPQCGTITIGLDPESVRPRQIEIVSQSLAAVRLFQDGGFDIRSHPDAVLADNIWSNAKDGLLVKGNNIHLDAGNGTVTITAREIIFESTGNDTGGITIRSKHNITIDSEDNVKIEGSNVAVAARNKMIIASKGFLNIRGINGVTITEPKQKLIPTSINDLIDTFLSSVLPGYF